MHCTSLEWFKLLSCSGRIQWLEEQLRCERAFNEDLKARLHDLEAQREASVPRDCNCERISGNSQEIIVCQLLYSLSLISASYYSQLICKRPTTGERMHSVTGGSLPVT